MLPTSTYRLQFRGDMTLQAAAELVPYFEALGISHLYASPIFAAVPGSTHGYDVTDFNTIDPVLGGMEGFRALSAEAKKAGLGLILDFVPNHMGASPFNPWWRDVLEWGRDSEYREHFDIDWSAKLLVPALGEPYGEALDNGLFGLELDENDGGLSFTYGGLRLPLTPPTYARILSPVEEEPFPELARRFAIARPETAAAAKEELARLARDPAVRQRLDVAVARIAGEASLLHELHEAQVWRLSHWRAAREALTYRRFFEIADLVGVRAERPRVFDESHKLLKELVERGDVQGVRLDHIDGLADPKAYLKRLQEALGGDAPSYLLVEKILASDEVIRSSWPVAGTTGYEFIAALAGLFVDPRSKAALTAAYEAFLGSPADYSTMARESKRRILTRNLAGELEFLRDLAKALAERDPMTRDFGADSLRRAILEFAVALPVYRTYVSVEGADAIDVSIIATAAETVKKSREVEDGHAVDFVARMLRLDFPDPERQGEALVFAARFQQTTGPVMAKAIEDTLFYRFNRLVALNEVGGEPDAFGAPVESFHRAMQARLKEQPSGLSATATHDTKRGEDARTRLYAISEMPAQWAEAVAHWSRTNARYRHDIGGIVPEPELEWLFYQALAGAWPAELDPIDRGAVAALADRMDAYMLKVVREAKARTSWTVPDRDYEECVANFVQGALSDRRFLKDFFARTAPLRLAGAVTSLSQLAIKITAPGVPDIYQGTEFWDLSLVDPDNRRPVDFAARESGLEEVVTTDPDALVRDWHTGRLKLRLMQAGLTFRREHAEFFAEGDYLPLAVAGAEEGHLIAFARRRAEEWLIVVAPRLPVSLLKGADQPLIPAERWGDTHVVLPEAIGGRILRDIVLGVGIETQGRIAASTALQRFPVALLHGHSSG